MLDFKRTAGRYRRGGQERDDVADADDSRAARCRSSAPKSTSSRHATAPSTSEAEQVGDYADGTEGWNERGKLTARPAQRLAEVPTGCAISEVTPDGCTGSDPPVVGQGQFLPNLAARRVSSFRRLGEADPRAHQQGLDGRHSHPERTRDLLVSHPTKFAHAQS